MSRRRVLIILGCSVLAGLIVGAIWFRAAPDAENGTVVSLDGTPVSAAVAGSVTLYFPGADGRLHPELRATDTNAEGEEMVRRVVAGVLSGPTDENLFAPLPPSTEIGNIFLGRDGTLYLDLSSVEHPVPPVAGSQRELLAAYSLVNSICDNIPAIRGVVLLWNSEQRTTFAGNLDTTRPLAPNRRLVSSNS